MWVTKRCERRAADAGRGRWVHGGTHVLVWARQNGMHGGAAGSRLAVVSG